MSHSPLPPIVNARLLSKAFGAYPLFRNVSFTVFEGDRIGLRVVPGLATSLRQPLPRRGETRRPVGP